MTIKLIYVGRGDAFVGVPARDLTDEDFAERAELWQELGLSEELFIKSGLYVKAEEAQAETKKPKRGTIPAAKEGE